MRVLFFEDSSKSLNGGGQEISAVILETLKKNKFQLLYCDFICNPKLNEKLTKNKDKVFILKSGKNRYSNIFFEFYLFIINSLRLIKNINDENVELIYACTKRALVYSYFLKILTNKNFVYHAHMVLQRKWHDWFILFFIKHAKYCFCVSEFVLESYKIQGCNNLILLKNPIDKQIAKPLKHSEISEFKIIYVGSLIKEKGVDYLLESLKHLKDISYRLDLFGEGLLLEELKKKYSCHNVSFHGYKDSINDEISKSHILILPSVIEEAAPIVINQAMLFGLPVITTNIGGQGFLVKNVVNGIKIEPKNSFELAGAIKKLIENEQLFNDISTNNINNSRNFHTIQDFERGLLNILENENTSAR